MGARTLPGTSKNVLDTWKPTSKIAPFRLQSAAGFQNIVSLVAHDILVLLSNIRRPVSKRNDRRDVLKDAHTRIHFAL